MIVIKIVLLSILMAGGGGGKEFNLNFLLELQGVINLINLKANHMEKIKI